MIADALLFVHFSLAAFITLGFFVIPLGYKFGWHWIKNRNVRLFHLFLIGFITAETIVGLTCPLTVLENMFRGVDYSRSFMSYWITQILYWDLPSEVFILLYTLCLGWVLILWKVCPPIKKNSERQ